MSPELAQSGLAEIACKCPLSGVKGDGMARQRKTKAPAAPSQKSRLKRGIIIDGHKTSISLEDDFWKALREISAAQGVRPSKLVTTINHGREHTNLSSAIRLYVLDYYRSRASGL
jgi:predicted DNA-binding ribbon-helix-helix protein